MANVASNSYDVSFRWIGPSPTFFGADLPVDGFISRAYCIFARMVQTTGNTGPYLQYAHARVTQILRRAEAEGLTYGAVTLLDEPAEQQLALMLSRFGEVVDDVAANLQPHKLCGYLYELAGAYSTFYEQCPVLKAPTPELRESRLMLCDLTARTIKLGLSLLGIDVVEQM